MNLSGNDIYNGNWNANSGYYWRTEAMETDDEHEVRKRRLKENEQRRRQRDKPGRDGVGRGGMNRQDWETEDATEG
jgi:hypothetical protein